MCVDGYLAVKSNGNPVFARSTDPNEMWVSLYEKAYAKFHGTYGALDGGVSSDAIADMTSSFSEVSELPNTPQGRDALWAIGGANMDAGVLMAAGTAHESDKRWDGYKKRDARGGGHWVSTNGLVMGHAYSVLARIPAFTHAGRTVRLLKIRNPWAGHEWNGAWSDSDKVWREYPELAKRLRPEGLKDDGIFLMEVADFTAFFSRVYFTTPFYDWSYKQFRDRVGTVAETHEFTLEINQQNTPVCIRLQRPSKRQMMQEASSIMASGYIFVYAADAKTLANMTKDPAAAKDPAKPQKTLADKLEELETHRAVGGGRMILNAGTYRLKVQPRLVAPYVFEVLCPSTAGYSVKPARTNAHNSSSDDEGPNSFSDPKAKKKVQKKASYEYVDDEDYYYEDSYSGGANRSRGVNIVFDDMADEDLDDPEFIDADTGRFF